MATNHEWSRRIQRDNYEEFWCKNCGIFKTELWDYFNTRYRIRFLKPGVGVAEELLEEPECIPIQPPKSGIFVEIPQEVIDRLRTAYPDDVIIDLWRFQTYQSPKKEPFRKLKDIWEDGEEGRMAVLQCVNTLVYRATHPESKDTDPVC